MVASRPGDAYVFLQDRSKIVQLRGPNLRVVGSSTVSGNPSAFAVFNGGLLAGFDDGTITVQDISGPVARISTVPGIARYAPVQMFLDGMTASEDNSRLYVYGQIVPSAHHVNDGYVVTFDKQWHALDVIVFPNDALQSLGIDDIGPIATLSGGDIVDVRTHRVLLAAGEYPDSVDADAALRDRTGHVVVGVGTEKSAFVWRDGHKSALPKGAIPYQLLPTQCGVLVIESGAKQLGVFDGSAVRSIPISGSPYSASPLPGGAALALVPTYGLVRVDPCHPKAPANFALTGSPGALAVAI